MLQGFRDFTSASTCAVIGYDVFNGLQSEPRQVRRRFGRAIDHVLNHYSGIQTNNAYSITRKTELGTHYSKVFGQRLLFNVIEKIDILLFSNLIVLPSPSDDPDTPNSAGRPLPAKFITACNAGAFDRGDRKMPSMTSWSPIQPERLFTGTMFHRCHRFLCERAHDMCPALSFRGPPSSPLASNAGRLNTPNTDEFGWRYAVHASAADPGCTVH
jgi:hypothetical protein